MVFMVGLLALAAILPANEGRRLLRSICRSSTSPSPTAALDPQQMEGMIASYYEYHFLIVASITSKAATFKTSR